MKELSVVIVNYNVRYFLEQCLESVLVASRGIDTEIWVVDNNSVDGSVAMVSQRFPMVHLIANVDNVGFAKANNQAISQCSGRRVLLLNPDTLVEPDTFHKCLSFMDAHPECGGLGVKMINGEGQYLKESKRGFPSPKTSFFKISGLIRLFPHHPVIAAYYMGHLSDDETNEIEILPGAFLMISQEALSKVGLLDESYFMYGEDIDFSWRIRLAGFKNYYMPETRIIHYKGESTKKGSLNYVYTFYNAMSIFARRYFSGTNAKLYTTLIDIAIWARAGLSFLKRLLAQVALPVADFVVAYAGFLGIKWAWASLWADNIDYYPPVYTTVVIPLYILILMAGGWLRGGYDRPIRKGRMFQGMALGTALLVVFYSMLNESLRYSRTLLLLGALWSMLAAVGIRGLLGLMGIKGFNAGRQTKRNLLIVGSQSECTRVQQLVHTFGSTPTFVGCVSINNSLEESAPSPTATTNDYFIGNIGQLAELIRYYKATEVIFCGKDLSTRDIISHMAQLTTTGVAYKIAPESADFLVGSTVINSADDLYTVDINAVSTSLNRRYKRLFDIGSSLLLLLFFPFLLPLQKYKRHYFSRCLSVLIGRYSWVGYAPSLSADDHNSSPLSTTPNASAQPTTSQEVLPPIRRGVFSLCDMSEAYRFITPQQLNLQYARNYKVSIDVAIVWRNLRRI
ncbi:MAG: glycosyltransferase [Bacteroidales bacterium]|nr:glycosyltransferase [Bacteroidales bacterium]